jgi:hypothetical protein
MDDQHAFAYVLFILALKKITGRNTTGRRDSPASIRIRCAVTVNHSDLGKTIPDSSYSFSFSGSSTFLLRLNRITIFDQESRRYNPPLRNPTITSWSSMLPLPGSRYA